MLGKMQRRAAIWILEAFKMSPSSSIKAITGLILINLHFQKLSGRLQLRSHSFPHNHILQSLMEPKTLLSSKLHSLSLSSLSKCQRELIKGPVIDMDNCFNEVFPSFDPLNPEFVLGCRIINIFPSCFLFNLFSKHNNDTLKFRICQLDNMTIESSNNTSHTLVITDASVKINIATSISHIHIRNECITKTLYHAVNVTSTEAKLFAIRCSINQAINSTGILKSLLLWIQFMLQERSLICHHISFKFI